MSDRGFHPDLIEEEVAAREAPPPEPPPAKPGRGRGRAPGKPSAEPPDPEAPAEAELLPPELPASAEPPPSPPEWLQQVREASDPQVILAALFKNVPAEELEKHDQISGWISRMGDRRARAMLQQAEQERLEQQKREAAARGDLYSLGELVAPEVQARQQQQSAAQQAAPFLDGVVAFQSKLPAEVQQQIQGKTFGVGKSYAEGVSEYLEAVAGAAISHRLNDAVEHEIKRREPALRKAWLSETNGTGPTPELDGGPAPSSREITDEQIAAMTLEEYSAHFDESGRPKPGTRVRLTRGIPLRQR